MAKLLVRYSMPSMLDDSWTKRFCKAGDY